MRRTTIRPLEARDIPFVLQLADECRLSRWSERDYIDELGRTDSTLLCATTKSKIVGFLVGRFVPGSETGLDAELYNIGVAPTDRGTGVGKLLLKHFLDRCTANRVRSVWLEVRASNATAIGFYRQFGFEMVSIRNDFYTNPTEDAVAMRLPLTGKPPVSPEDRA